ncbi:hypothetical protein D8B34_03625 [Verminephrobacter eiseniae]|nr:hypothetical protein [Verminephrobacter eiseniae]MCW5295492.1 hypothetical protein [Verminephrobacter eiseniae]MCW8185895.1 hypothetical protein [Verminephrobacter eiseniae]MCW8223737.1 hypothetical protein [Verminephrobacter eiseniae]MCW8232913.1 hypothetical protein [Verminephrobacter eiseniae]
MQRRPAPTSALAPKVTNPDTIEAGHHRLAARASPSAQTTQRIPTSAQGAARLPAPSAWKRQTTGASGCIRARRDGCALRV